MLISFIFFLYFILFIHFFLSSLSTAIHYPQDTYKTAEYVKIIFF